MPANSKTGSTRKSTKPQTRSSIKKTLKAETLKAETPSDDGYTWKLRDTVRPIEMDTGYYTIVASVEDRGGTGPAWYMEIDGGRYGDYVSKEVENDDPPTWIKHTVETLKKSSKRNNKSKRHKYKRHKYKRKSKRKSKRH
jgi:hypothetical protein